MFDADKPRAAFKVTDASREILEQIICETIEPDTTYVAFKPGGFAQLTIEDVAPPVAGIAFPHLAVLSYIQVIIDE